MLIFELEDGTRLELSFEEELAPQFSLTAYEGATTGRGLLVALIWWPIAFVLAVAYALTVFRSFRGKVGSGR